MLGASGKISSSSALTSATFPSAPFAPMNWQDSFQQHSTKLNTSKSSAAGVWIKKMSECPDLHWRWDLHVCGDLINKAQFCRNLSSAPTTKEALERTSCATYEHPPYECKYLFFMYVQFAFLHIQMGKKKTKMQSTKGMMEPEVGSTKYLGEYLLD